MAKETQKEQIARLEAENEPQRILMIALLRISSLRKN